MARITAALAILVALWPAGGAANAPPPDPFFPCEGKALGEACSVQGCFCFETFDSGGFSCPQDATLCLACQHPDGEPCPFPYDGPERPYGCASATPTLSSLAGLAAVLLLLRRRTRAR